jgi:DNA invertase Pin-like site-specific DNA recombinase
MWPELTVLEAVRARDTLVVPKLDRLARSTPAPSPDTLITRGGSTYDPNAKMIFAMLAMFAEFEADLLKMRTREGRAMARLAR